MRVGSFLALLAALLGLTGPVAADEPPATTERPCSQAVDRYFADEVWSKVGARKCLTCHKSGGDAEGSLLVLRDPEKSAASGKADALRHNHDVFARIAKLKEGDEHKLLLKVTGGLFTSSSWRRSKTCIPCGPEPSATMNA